MPERRRARSGALAVLGSQSIVVAVSAVAVLAAVGLLLFAWWDQQIRPRQELAVEVGDRSYNMEYWARRFKLAYDDPANASDARSGFSTTLADKTSDAIIRDAVLLQRAGALGISASQTEIDREMLIRSDVGVVTDTPEGQEPGPDDPLRITPNMENAIRARLQDVGFTLAQYRAVAEAALLRQKAENLFLEQQPARGPQARIRVLQLPHEADARLAVEKIRSGESTFEDLANTVSLDAAGKGQGGLRDWLPRGILPKPLDDAAFSLPLNTLSEPIDSGLENGWFLIQVLERADERDLSEPVRKQLAQNDFTTWLEQQKQELGARNLVTVDDVLWADEFLGIRAAASAADPNLPGGLPNVPVQPQPAPAAPEGTAPIAPAPAAPPPPSSP